MNAPIRLAVYSAFPTMRTLLVSAFREERDCVVVESGLVTSGSAPPAPVSTDNALPPEILIIDIDSADNGQLTAARSLRRSRQLPSLLFVPDLTPSQEVLFRREGFTVVRRRPKIRDFTTREGRSPVMELLFAMASTIPGTGRGVAPGGGPRAGGVPGTPSETSPATQGMSRSPGPPVSPALESGASPGHDAPVVVIGASTGGPQAIRHVLQGLPLSVDASVLIVQHISSGFAAGFVRWLRETTHRAVEIAQAHTYLRRGQILVAPTDMHLVLRMGYAELTDGERRNYQKPSVDVLFESAAEYYGARTIGVLLTGMGRDGGDGCLALVKKGAVTLVQNEETSVVYGMPRAAVELEAATEVLPLDQIGTRIGTLLAQRSAPKVSS